MLQNTFLYVHMLTFSLPVQNFSVTLVAAGVPGGGDPLWQAGPSHLFHSPDCGIKGAFGAGCSELIASCRSAT